MPSDALLRRRKYGHAHRLARLAYLAELRDGDPCARCGLPMHESDAADLDLDHAEDGITYRGLAHAACNRSAGAVKGNRMRAPERPHRNSIDW